jgi:hypothetical protein
VVGVDGQREEAGLGPLALDDGLGVGAVEVGSPDRAVAAVGPVQVAGVDGQPERPALAGDEGARVAAVQVGRPDRAPGGPVDPVDMVGVDRHPGHEVRLDGEDRLRVAAVQVGHIDRAVVLVAPVETAGVDRHSERVGRGEEGLWVAAVQVGRRDGGVI